MIPVLAMSYLSRAAFLVVTLALAPEARAEKMHSFPEGFKWCVATSAHQIEGNNDQSDWWDWEQRPNVAGSCRIKNCETSGVASDHWNRLEQDIELLKGLHVKQYRFGIEWAKIEPAPGQFDNGAIEHYRDEIRLLEQAGIEPMITLQHFTLPRWVAHEGGWSWVGMPEAFEAFARLVYTEIAGTCATCRDWITVNEPMVHLGGGYILGITPPGFSDARFGAHSYFDGVGSPTEIIKRLKGPLLGMLRSHARVYHALHAEAKARGRDIRIGMAHHVRVFDPKRSNVLDWLAARVVDDLWNWMLPNALYTGIFQVSIPFMIHEEEEIPGLRGTQDFFGVNYYSRDIVKFKWDHGASLAIEVKKNAPVNDLGWEIYPKGLFRTLLSIHKRYSNLPILITENGTADARDAFRSKFIVEHLTQLQRALKRNVPVEGYCHWSLLDNFEWVEGFSPRFGLYEVNYSTQERIPRASASLFSEIAKHNRLSEGLCQN